MTAILQLIPAAPGWRVAWGHPNLDPPWILAPIIGWAVVPDDESGTTVTGVSIEAGSYTDLGSMPWVVDENAARFLGYLRPDQDPVEMDLGNIVRDIEESRR